MKLNLPETKKLLIKESYFLIIIPIAFVLFISAYKPNLIIPHRSGCSIKKPRNYGYIIKYKEKTIKNLKMIGSVGRHGVEGSTSTERLRGKILRALRFQNITSKVEKKYGIPNNLILAMVMHESGGADLVPNGADDGGLGLCHMQPKLATEFGLRTHKNNRKLVDKTHGRQLRALIKKHSYDRKNLIQYDDRFHPILNLDAVGRMLDCYKTPRIKGLSTWQTAVRRYAGKYNYSKYWEKVSYYRERLGNKHQINLVRNEFNRKNPSLLINGVKGSFDKYIETHQEQNFNYGLNEY